MTGVKLFILALFAVGWVGIAVSMSGSPDASLQITYALLCVITSLAVFLLIRRAVRRRHT